jgi:serine/threonine protein kinase
MSRERKEYDDGDDDEEEEEEEEALYNPPRNTRRALHFDVESRYQLLHVIGRGAYGIVCAAHDTENTNEKCAIKKIFNCVANSTMLKRTLREVRLLRLLKHENIIGLKKIMLPQSGGDFRDLYIVSDLMEADLSSIIKSPQILSDKHAQFFIYQVFCGLKFMHSCGVIHRDLKPRNLLVNRNCDLKICDFGLARLLKPDNYKQFSRQRVCMTDYVATRWYRAPEVIMGWRSHSKPLDMWGCGCILAEIIGRRPLFPGSDSPDQLLQICRILGRPPNNLIQNVPNEAIRTFIVQDIPETEPIPLEQLFEGVEDLNPEACDLLQKLLCMDPEQRITVEEALSHPYLHDLHIPAFESNGPEIDDAEFAFEESIALSSHDLEALILQEIGIYGQEEGGSIRGDFKSEEV